MATNCTHPQPKTNVGTRAMTRKPAARAWCPACGLDTGFIDGGKDTALEALKALPPAKPAPKQPAPATETP